MKKSLCRVAIGPSSFAHGNDAPLRMLQEAEVTVIPNPYARRLTEDEIVAHLDGVNGLLAGLEPLNRKVLASAAPTLRAIARVGIGMDNVDLDTARELGIRVSNTPEGPTDAVAEMTLAAMLSLCRNLNGANSALHRGHWDKTVALGLKDTPVLVIGYGRIGRKVGELLRSFGASVMVSDPALKDDDLHNGEVSVSLSEGIGAAKIISLHAGGTAGIIGEKEFALMKDGTILLNSARAALVDENALIDALDSGRLAGAWFDVFWTEPYTGQLKEYEQVLITPHVSTYTSQCRLSMELSAVRNLLRDMEI